MVHGALILGLKKQRQQHRLLLSPTSIRKCSKLLQQCLLEISTLEKKKSIEKRLNRVSPQQDITNAILFKIEFSHGRELYSSKTQ